MSVLLALSLAGCAARGNVELLETQLRQQEDQLAALERQLAEVQTELRVARGESAALRAQVGQSGSPPALLPEQADVLYRATGVRFHSLLTDGVDRDGSPGDELLTVLMQPHDGEGGLLKLPGTIELKVLDLAEPGGQQELGTWSFSAAESRTYWHDGFLSSGYLFELPWKRLPSRSELTVHAQFTTPDGREFHATQQVRVTPAAPAAPPQAARAGTTARQTTTLRLPPPAPQAASAEAVSAPVASEPATAPAAGPALSGPPREPGAIDTSDRFTERDRPTYR